MVTTVLEIGGDVLMPSGLWVIPSMGHQMVERITVSSACKPL